VVRTREVDPGKYQCARFAAELADEWVEAARASEWSESSVRGYVAAIEAVCTFVDETLPQLMAAEASLGRGVPDLLHVLMEWVRLLPAKYPVGSTVPSGYVEKVRLLVRRRFEHPSRAVTPNFEAWLAGHTGVRKGKTKELPEYTRQEKVKMVQASLRSVLATSKRLAAGRALAEQGDTSAARDSLEIPDLLGAIWSGVPTREICEALPSRWDMPEHFEQFIAPDSWPGAGKMYVMQGLTAMLFPTDMDLHAYRILLMSATGRTSEEVSGLTEEDVEYLPDGVSLRFEKDRANKISGDEFSKPDGQGEDVAVLAAVPRLDAGWVVHSLLEAVRPVAERMGASPIPLFVKAAIQFPDLLFSRFYGQDSTTGLSAWFAANGIEVKGKADIRRLRKSGKVEKAITYRGRISDIADDHSEEAYRGHYAHGTTLRVISGKVITGAQQHWFAKAIQGPIVIAQDGDAALDEQDAPDRLGVTRERLEEARSGAMDMGVTECTNPYESPYGVQGEACPVAPLRCLECRHAFILPSNLPQLLLFSDHLEQLKLRLPPKHFHALWGQSHANLKAVLDDRTDTEKALARKLIEAEGLTLQLPMSARVEFDL
jgi:hypothetical protein